MLRSPFDRQSQCVQLDRYNPQSLFVPHNLRVVDETSQDLLHQRQSRHPQPRLDPRAHARKTSVPAHRGDPHRRAE